MIDLNMFGIKEIQLRNMGLYGVLVIPKTFEQCLLLEETIYGSNNLEKTLIAVTLIYSLNNEDYNYAENNNLEKATVCWFNPHDITTPSINGSNYFNETRTYKIRKDIECSWNRTPSTNISNQSEINALKKILETYLEMKNTYQQAKSVIVH